MLERREKVLRATILDHIQSPTPVGSKVLESNYQLNASSATIRNDLKILEEEGYLTHLHASSGRIPTDKGYRFYLDTLMQKSAFENEMDFLSLVCHDLKSMYSEIAQLMSDTLPYATMVVPSSYVEQILRVVQMMVLGLDRVLVVVLHSAGVNEEFVLNFKHEMTQSDLDRFSRMLSERLKGRSINDISDDDPESLAADFPEMKSLIRAFIQGLDQAIKRQNISPKLYTSGVSNLLNYPEFHDMEIAQSVMRSLEEATELLDLVNLSRQNSINAFIGSETASESLSECSFITAPVKNNDVQIASIGVLGPKRLMYRTVMPYVERIASRFSDWFSYKF